MTRVWFCSKDGQYVSDDLAERCGRDRCPDLISVCRDKVSIWLQKHYCTGAASTTAK